MPIEYTAPEVSTIRTGRKYGPGAPTGPAQSALNRTVTLLGDVTGNALDTGGPLTIPTTLRGLTVNDIAELQTALDGKQGLLTAGDNITIEDNLISATGEAAGYDDSELRGLIGDNSDAIATLDDLIAQLNDNKQDRLTAGNNITISGNVISAVDTVYDDTAIRDLIGSVIGLPATDSPAAILKSSFGTPSWLEPTGFGQTLMYDHSGLKWDDTLYNGITAIQALIPSQATPSNLLADKDFVNSSINAMAAHQLTYNAAGDPFPTKSALTSATTFYYKGAPFTPTEHDYVVVMADETNGGAQVRYVFNGAQWVFSYKINDAPFTAAQIAAINSNITAALTVKLTALPTAAELTTSFNGKVSTTQTINGVAYGTGNITITAAPTAHNHAAADITSGTFADARIASAATWNAKYTLPSGGTAAQYINGLGALTAFPTSMTPTAHNHAAADITSGTFADARIASAATWNAKYALPSGGTAAQYINGLGALTTFPTSMTPTAHNFLGSEHTMGAITAQSVLIAASANTPSWLTATTNSTVLKRNSSGTLIFSQISDADITANAITAGKLTGGTAGQVLTSNGSSAASWQNAATGGGTLTGITAGTGISVTASATSPTVALTTPVSLANGGLASTILNTTAGVLYKSSAANPGALSLATPAANTVLRGTSATAMSFGAIVNADISATAAIAVSKLALPSSNTTTTYLRGDGTWAAPSATPTFSGLTTGGLIYASSATAIASSANVISNTTPGALVKSGTSLSLSLATAANGALYSTGTTVTPSFGTLPVGQGGTGLTTLSAANRILYSTGATAMGVVAAPATVGQVLTYTAANTFGWTTPSGGNGSYVLKAGDTMTGLLQHSQALSNNYFEALKINPPTNGGSNNSTGGIVLWQGFCGLGIDLYPATSGSATNKLTLGYSPGRTLGTLTSPSGVEIGINGANGLSITPSQTVLLARDNNPKMLISTSSDYQDPQNMNNYDIRIASGNIIETISQNFKMLKTGLNNRGIRFDSGQSGSNYYSQIRVALNSNGFDSDAVVGQFNLTF